MNTGSKPTVALLGLSLCMLLSSLGTSIANVALPTLAEVFSASFQGVQWVVLAYLLAITSLIVGVGRLGDLFGRRRLLLAGLALFTLASMACSLAPTLALLIVARAAQGLGAASMMALTLAFVGDTVPKHRVGSAMGLLGTMSAVGTALGPALGGGLIAGLGWPALFWINLPLGLLAMALVWRHLPPDLPRSVTARFDSLGTLLLALTLAAYALALTLGRGHFAVLNLALLLAAAAGVLLFGLVESRVRSPLIRLDLLRAPGLSPGLWMSALVTTVVMTTLVVGPFYLSGGLLLDPAGVGLVMSVGPIVAAMTGVPAGRLVDRFGSGRTTLAGLSAMAIGCGLLSSLPSRYGVPGYVAPMVLLTAGYALFQAANNTAIMANASAEQRGLVSGLLNLSRNLGLITGASAMGAVFAIGAATDDLTHAAPEAIVAGMRLGFAVAVVLVLAALAVAGMKRTKPV